MRISDYENTSGSVTTPRKRNRVPELFEAFGIVVDESVSIELLEKVIAELTVFGSLAEQVIDDNEDAASYRERCPLFAPTRGNSVVLGGEVGVFRVACCPRRFHEKRAQPLAAVGRLAASPFAGILVVSRTHPSQEFK